MEETYSIAEQQRVETALVQYYLRSDGPFGAGALRYIDASPRQVAAALGLDEEQDSVKVLGRACGGAVAMSRVLARGVAQLNTADDTPGFFRYLVMTCAIVATADQNDETQEFGENLAMAFGSPNLFANREALGKLWVRLQNWCNRQSEAGAPVRKMLLPPSAPGTGKHLGLTHAIAFPGWRDVLRLKALIDGSSRYSQINDPIAAAKALCARLKGDPRFSPALREACEEFERLYFAKASLLEFHRFWIALRHALETDRRPTSSKAAFPQLHLRFGSDIEEVDLQANAIDQKGALQEEKKLEGCPDEVLRQLPNWLEQSGLSITGTALRAAAGIGLIPFLEERFGLWVSTLSAPNIPTRSMLLLGKDKSHLARRWGAEAISIGENWTLAGPIPARDTSSVYQYLGDLASNVQTPFLPALRISGGFKTSNGYVGRVSVLPKVIEKGPGVLSFKSNSSGRVVPSLVKDELGFWRIESPFVLEGAYAIVLEEKILQDAEPLAVERALSFFPDAIEHTELPFIDNTRWSVTPETSKGELVALNTTIAFSPDDDLTVSAVDAATRFDDFLEALYAGGRSGWAEQDLISAMDEILGPSAPSPWDILRGLTEGDWLVETSNMKWRGRRWWLIAPSIVRITLADGRAALLLRGSAPTRVRRRFAETVSAAGCTISLRLGVGDYSPVSMLATGETLHAVVDELGWSVTDASTVRLPAAPRCWPDEMADESRHRRVGKWRWDRGTFDKRLVDKSDSVNIERYRRERRDREDLFVVSGRRNEMRFTTASRVVAISEAYRRMGVPYFRYVRNLLVRIPEDGYLVRSLASEAVVRAARNSGPLLVEGRWVYAYPADPYIVHNVRRVFGPSFVVAETTKTGTEELQLSPSSFGLLRHRKIFSANGRSMSLKRTGRR
ncbi:hypothetical protein N0A02_13500 [Paraburkholderia acidicola]|uniref:Uncharacterized protein n=1 Tax=Paraburkholderia acidicola TaxID=1912599 RepID=A0ABV1LMD3_9BURK